MNNTKPDEMDYEGHNPVPIWIIIIALCLLAWGIYWFYTQFEGVSHSMNKDNWQRMERYIDN
ncbi:hypothetical protein N9N03_01680 [Chlamydiia bacterium]|jgi:hypothetical protein|nr:hypothetical protein [Chlamydiia bacterium]